MTQLKREQLAAHLARGLRPLYAVHGDEPLLVQEVADAIRAAARAAGHAERKVYTVAGAYFNWSELLGAARSLSLFAQRQLIEIRIPSGKPGKDGSDALQRYCCLQCDEVLTLVLLPRLDFQQTKSAWFAALDGAGASIKVEPVERRALPLWIAERLAKQGQHVQGGPHAGDGQRTLAFFADRIEGNLLAAHQEIQKLALLYPKGELSFAQVEAAVLNVARYDVSRLREAVLAGHVARALRMLDGLQAEGEAAVLVHWSLAEDIRALQRVKTALGEGRPLPLALREARVWGAREPLFERALTRVPEDVLLVMVVAAQVCDGVVKGIPHPDWPADPWEALKRLVLMVVAHTGALTKSSRPIALHA